MGSKIQLFGYYVLNYSKSDASGVSSFPSNSYDISADYGRSSFDVRNRLFLGGSIALPRSIRLNPFFVASSGSPFNITTTNDLNNDSIFNDRPGFVSNASCPGAGTQSGSIFCTPLGTYDAAPTAGEKITPINSATGPSHIVMNLRLTKTFGFGPKTTRTAGSPGGDGGGRGGGGRRGGTLFGGGPQGLPSSSDRRYNLSIGASARNVFNKVNFGNPSGILGSRFFDTPNGLQGGSFSNSSANRRIDLIATFNF